MTNESMEIKKNVKISNAQRSILINKVVNGSISIKEAACHLDIPYENAKKIIQVYKTENRINVKKTGNSNFRKINEEILNNIIQKIENNPTVTLEEIKNGIWETCQVSVSKETIRKSLKNIGITRKLLVSTIESVNNSTSKEKRRIFARTFLDNYHDDSHNIFIDESGFNLHIRRTFGRSGRGCPAYVTVPTLRRTNISLISAINNNEVLHSVCKVGSINSADFLDFLNALIIINREKNLNNATFFLIMLQYTELLL